MTTPLPETMTCIEISEDGKLIEATRPLPVAGPGEVLIEVEAAGINRPDILQRQGLYPPPEGASDIPGLEIAGTVVALSKDVTGIAIGDEVCALVTGGGYAEYCTAPAPQCLPIPSTLEMDEAAALPECFFTVWSNVFQRAALKPDETLLVHGGSSGIGTTAIQMAHALGSTVIVTAGYEEKCGACEVLGADLAIDYNEEDFVAKAKEFTDGRGVNVILDMVGGDYVQRNLKALAPDGRLVNIAFLKGSKVEVDLMSLMLKRLTITGSTLRARSVEFKAAIAKDLEEKIWPLIEAEEITPFIHATFPLTEAMQAHELMESSEHIGKLVLIP
ncbi:MAG: NAD(P)H-quinone oxidoreductase [Rhodospirillaceae bacterium]|nr:NAD(P)H-quinone oxidoreductase [Rhodospirillaceae bacterium]MBT4220396.1 NAD(P)H-quinone oxidoreductase [Rhodospirillaceae bacterium]MBT4464411.1 NAD(P)H-quinone oxidoreductase [Rhodospirillaceae bacterium]MBT5013501.1 NAD(P)H-quinone oxidoreductase [Rhodospirillaceae bacterium]MBT5307795.1 NAD(P)H-quinone oxidoreductase [Rhodospirillaceae bacterium]